MEIIVAKNAGFCGGVERTIKLAEELLSQGSIYCLGEIVHNEQVIYELEKKEMKTVNSIDEVPDRGKVIFRAHGESLEIYENAKKRNIEIQDLTCPKVKIIHDKVQKAKNDSFIIIVGLKKHPETIGTAGFAGENFYIIENEDDILDSYIEYEKTQLGKVYVVSQTTFSSKKFDDLADEILNNFAEAEVVIDKTICNSTENRQLEAKKISLECDTILVVGGKNSSNTRKLFEIASENCNSAYYVQTVQDLKNIEILENSKVGILAGASTPKYVIDDIKEELERKYSSGSSKRLERV